MRALILLVAGILLGLPGAGQAVGEPLLVGTVRADFSIDLKDSNGNAVTSLSPGTYDFEIRDEAAIHNFHLTGPDVDLKTDEAYVGTTTWEDVVLGSGSTYNFVCDPHAGYMNGSFTTTGSPPPPPPPPPPPSPPPPSPPPPPPAPPPAPQPQARQTVTGFRVSIVRANGRRWLVARARVTLEAQASLRLLRRHRTVASGRRRFKQGPNELRVVLPRRLARGTYVARLTVGGATRPYTARIAIG